MIPTAQEFLNNYRFEAGEHIGNRDFDTMARFAIEFAKLHCEEFREDLLKNTKIKEVYFSLEDTPLSLIKEMIENGGAGRYDSYGNAYAVTVSSIDGDSIINSYPLTNIK